MYYSSYSSKKKLKIGLILFVTALPAFASEVVTEQTALECRIDACEIQTEAQLTEALEKIRLANEQLHQLALQMRALNSSTDIALVSEKGE